MHHFVNDQLWHGSTPRVMRAVHGFLDDLCFLVEGCLGVLMVWHLVWVDRAGLRRQVGGGLGAARFLWVVGWGGGLCCVIASLGAEERIR